MKDIDNFHLYLITGQVICQDKNNRKEVQILDSEKRIDEQAKAARAEYFREWRRKNPDKVRENNRKYWQRRAARLAAEREGGGGEADAKAEI